MLFFFPQIHELRAKLSTTEQALEQASKSGSSKNEILDATEKKLEEERASADALKIKLDESSREKHSLQVNNLFFFIFHFFKIMLLCEILKKKCGINLTVGIRLSS